MFSKRPLKINSDYILVITALYLTVILAADVVAYKFIGYKIVIESGATLIFPLTYLISDVVAEVYGYDTARRLIWIGLFCELIFSLLIIGVIKLPSAFFMHNDQSFEIALGSMFRFVLSGFVANIISSFVNIYCISKWKIITKGKFFWLRCIASTAIAELLLVVITGVLAFSGKMDSSIILNILISAYALEMLYSVIFVWPAWTIISFLKRVENIDSYDHDVNYNPFKLNS